MVTQVFKRIFQISFISGFLAAFFARVNGWQPTISSIEGISVQSPLICVFHSLTGWDCPGCGLTRSLISFFVGDLPLSFYFHPLGPLAGILICYLFFVSFKKKPQWFFPTRWSPHRSWSFLLIVIAWGILRNS